MERLGDLGNVPTEFQPVISPSANTNAINKLKPAVYNVGLLSLSSIRTDNMVSNDKPANGTLSALQAAKVFTKVTSADKHMGGRISSAQVARRNRIQSALKRPQSASSATKVDLVVENTFQSQARGEMPSAPRNSPDITKERFSSDAVNGNSIRVTIPNVVESDDDDYYNLSYLENPSDGDIMADSFKGFAGDRAEQDIGSEGDVHRLVYTKVPMTAKSANAFSASAISEDSGEPGLPVTSLLNSSDNVKEGNISVTSPANSAYFESRMRANSGSQQATGQYSKVGVFGDPRNAADSIAIETAPAVLGRAQTAPAKGRGGGKQMTAGDAKQIVTAPTAVAVAYYVEDDDGSNIAQPASSTLNDDVDIREIEARSNAKKTKNRMMKTPRAKREDMPLEDELTVKERNARKAKARERIFKRVPFGITNILGTVNSDEEDAKVADGEAAAVDVSVSRSNWQTMFLSRGEQNYYELSLHKKSLAPAAGKKHNKLREGPSLGLVTKTIKTYHLNSRQEAVEQKTVHVVECADDARRQPPTARGERNADTSRRTGTHEKVQSAGVEAGDRVGTAEAASADRKSLTLANDTAKYGASDRTSTVTSKFQSFRRDSNTNEQAKPSATAVGIGAGGGGIGEKRRPASSSQLMRRRRQASASIKHSVSSDAILAAQPIVPEVDTIPEPLTVVAEYIIADSNKATRGNVNADTNKDTVDANKDAHTSVDANKCAHNHNASRPQSKAAASRPPSAASSTALKARSRPQSAPVSIHDHTTNQATTKYRHKMASSGRAKSAKPNSHSKPIEIWTRQPTEEEDQLPGIQWCRDLRTQLLGSGLDVPLNTLVRALVPPVGYTVGGTIYESNQTNMFPSSSASLLHKPVYWFSSRQRSLIRKQTAELLDLSSVT